MRGGEEGGGEEGGNELQYLACATATRTHNWDFANGT